MAQEGKWKQRWSAFGEKTRWMETSTGRLVVLGLALCMVVWSVTSSFTKSNPSLNSETEQSYTLSE